MNMRADIGGLPGCRVRVPSRFIDVEKVALRVWFTDDRTDRLLAECIRMHILPDIHVAEDTQMKALRHHAGPIHLTIKGLIQRQVELGGHRRPFEYTQGCPVLAAVPDDIDAIGVAVIRTLILQRDRRGIALTVTHDFGPAQGNDNAIVRAVIVVQRRGDRVFEIIGIDQALKQVSRHFEFVLGQAGVDLIAICIFNRLAHGGDMEIVERLEIIVRPVEPALVGIARKLASGERKLLRFRLAALDWCDANIELRIRRVEFKLRHHHFDEFEFFVGESDLWNFSLSLSTAAIFFRAAASQRER